jgi:hypothetical protein
MTDKAVAFTWKITPGLVAGADGVSIYAEAGQTTQLLASHAKRYEVLGYGSIGTKAVGRPYEIADQDGLDEMLREQAAQAPEESKPVRGPINVARGGRLV